MDPEDADPAPEARPPLLEDLASLCRNLNRLWRTKDTVRDRDRMDRAFLARLLASRGEALE